MDCPKDCQVMTLGLCDKLKLEKENADLRARVEELKKENCELAQGKRWTQAELDRAAERKEG
jgi:hypothetical protein